MPQPEVDLLVGSRSEPATDARYALARHAALLLTESGNGFILNMADRFYAVNSVTALMLRESLSRGEAEIAALVASRYGVDRTVVQADYDRLLEDLVVRGVIRLRGASDRSHADSVGASALARIAATVLPALASEKARAAVALTLTRLSFVSFGWLATLTAWQRRFPIRAGEIADVDSVTTRIAEAVRALSAWLPFGGDCKERALSSWAMARLAGVDAIVVVGVVQYPLRAHSWCETDSSTVIGDDTARCRRYLPVFTYR